MEHVRTNVHQWCDTEKCVIMNIADGKFERFFGGMVVGTLPYALEYVKKLDVEHHRADHLVIVPFSGIVGFPL